MKFGLDLAFPPTAALAAEMSSLGYTFCICYIGGDGALAGDAWHIIDGQRYPVRDIAPSFPDGFMPTYVPGQDPFGYTGASGAGDGADANEQTGACGFNETSPIFLDIQFSIWTRNPAGVMAYIPEFVRVCNEVGHPVVVYGPTTLVDMLVPQVGIVVDGVWGADIILTGRNNAPASFWSWADPAEPPPWSFWQCGSGTIAGISVDYDTATDDARLAPYAGP